jgi:arylsulfatase A-like enzyme
MPQRSVVDDFPSLPTTDSNQMRIAWVRSDRSHLANQGIMSGKTPNLDKLAAQGMRFTDYYAEASCTAGRANFITGE